MLTKRYFESRFKQLVIKERAGHAGDAGLKSFHHNNEVSRPTCLLVLRYSRPSTSGCQEDCSSCSKKE